MLKQNKKWLVMVFAIMVALVMLAGCNGGGGGGGGQTGGGGDTPATSSGGGGGGGGAAPDFIKIGIPNPNTGPLAGFGIGTPWAELLVEDAINADGGIYIEEYDKKIPIKCFFVDTESDATKAGEVTQQLITNNGVNVLIARHTPGTALPVSQMAETMKVPFVSLECPVNPWLAGGPYEWGYHSFWYVEDNCDMFMDMWAELGYGEGTIVGGIFPNDPDGLAWIEVFQKKLPERGYKLIVPGISEMMQNDWTNFINEFKKEGVQIITGVPITPDFASFAQQAVAQGLKFDIATCGRAFLFPSDAEANPKEIIPRLTNEVWWSPWHPWKSSIDGMTCQQLADAYEAETGLPWSPPMGYKYAGMEIAVDALTRAASLDPVKIRDAIGATDLNTMVGPIKYDQETHVAQTVIVGGQWKVVDDPNAQLGYRAEIEIVFNAPFPAIPKNGTLHVPN